jgi:hypothetical protein
MAITGMEAVSQGCDRTARRMVWKLMGGVRKKWP